ncbi:hypothetical protein GLAREA_03228 [Glarea lozoyensis ATCC 20868]|uniref:Mitotic-spindle organizing protein 1 n=1 Tax=Glarea lozoyensis (strain ATCC 20868 / MF5171) TaxID=1116229 RepID=S3DL90_GLAL2|nr:uncharacterized protein GLAREA_03228 [Glarea lozoyensis ATCC 20868]EPE27313.1 hypothetical protein GLAREA_03228 [Glarea lozoyensis ATCC 20868]
MPPAESSKDIQQVRQIIDVFHEISTLLNANLDRHTLSICISLIENGVNPEALATVIKELKRDGEETMRQVEQNEG